MFTCIQCLLVIVLFLLDVRVLPVWVILLVIQQVIQSHLYESLIEKGNLSAHKAALVTTAVAALQVEYTAEGVA